MKKPFQSEVHDCASADFLSKISVFGFTVGFLGYVVYDLGQGDIFSGISAAGFWLAACYFVLMIVWAIVAVSLRLKPGKINVWVRYGQRIVLGFALIASVVVSSAAKVEVAQSGAFAVRGRLAVLRSAEHHLPWFVIGIFLATAVFVGTFNAMFVSVVRGGVKETVATLKNVSYALCAPMGASAVTSAVLLTVHPCLVDQRDVCRVGADAAIVLSIVLGGTIAVSGAVLTYFSQLWLFVNLSSAVHMLAIVTLSMRGNVYPQFTILPALHAMMMALVYYWLLRTTKPQRSVCDLETRVRTSCIALYRCGYWLGVSGQIGFLLFFGIRALYIVTSGTFPESRLFSLNRALGFVTATNILVPIGLGCAVAKAVVKVVSRFMPGASSAKLSRPVSVLSEFLVLLASLAVLYYFGVYTATMPKSQKGYSRLADMWNNDRLKSMTLATTGLLSSPGDLFVFLALLGTSLICFLLSLLGVVFRVNYVTDRVKPRRFISVGLSGCSAVLLAGAISAACMEYSTPAHITRTYYETKVFTAVACTIIGAQWIAGALLHYLEKLFASSMVALALMVQCCCILFHIGHTCNRLFITLIPMCGAVVLSNLRFVSSKPDRHDVSMRHKLHESDRYERRVQHQP